MKLMAVILILILIVPMLAACGNTQQEANPRQEISPAQEGAEPESETLAFFKSLDYSDGMNVVKAIFDRWPLQYGTTLGLNGAPQIRPIEFKFILLNPRKPFIYRLLSQFPRSNSFPFPLLFPSWAKTRETFSAAACYLIQQAGRGAFGFPRCVGVDVHCGTHIGVT